MFSLENTEYLHCYIKFKTLSESIFGQTILPSILKQPIRLNQDVLKGKTHFHFDNN